MRILHIITTLDPAHGGPPSIAAKLAAAQASFDHQVVIFSAQAPDRKALIAQSLQGIPWFERVRLVTIPAPTLLEVIFGQQIHRALEPLVQEADVVHIHSVWGSLLYRGAKIAKRFNKPYFVLLNGMLDPWALSQRWLKKRIALALGYRRMLNDAAALHLGNAQEDELIRPLRLSAKTAIIPNGVFAEEITNVPAKGTFSAAHPELRGRRFILFLSRLHYKKGLDYLAKSFSIVAARIPDVQLVVAGPDGGEKENFLRMIHEAKLVDRVHMVGPIYGPQKYAALVDASCYCLPSRQEGFSVAITEALGMGIPAVITEGCHFPEVAEVGAGIVTPLDEQAIADAIVTILNDPVRAQSMSSAGREFVLRELTWPSIAKRTIQLYQRSL